MDIQDLPDRLLSKFLNEADLIPVSDAIPEQRGVLLHAGSLETTNFEIL